MIQRRRVEELWANRDFRGLIFLGCLALLALVFAVAIRGILGPFILAVVLALLINPVVNAAEHRKIPRVAALAALYVLFGAGLVGIVLYLFPIARDEFAALVGQGPAIANYFQDLAENHHVVSVLGIPVDVRQAYDAMVRNLPGLLAGQLQSVVQNVFMLLNWLFQAVLVLLIAFFLVKDAHKIRHFFEDLVPYGYREDARDLSREISQMLGAYMRGQLTICAMIGVVTGIAMWLVGVPYALALGMIAGVTAFIPFIGPFIGVVPAVAVAAFVSQSMSKVVLVLIIYFAISNIIYNFVSPKVFGDAVHLSPMLIIFAFVVGGYMGGILGLFIAVPVAAIVRILFLYVHERVYA